MHEVVTLQFGQQANYVGTHFWNAQVSPLFNFQHHSKRNHHIQTSNHKQQMQNGVSNNMVPGDCDGAVAVAHICGGSVRGSRL